LGSPKFLNCEYPLDADMLIAHRWATVRMVFDLGVPYITPGTY